MTAGRYLTDADVDLIRTVVHAVLAELPNPRGDEDYRTHQAPEVYIAKPQSSAGIPALTPAVGTADDDKAGNALCDIYQIIDIGTAGKIKQIFGLNKTVYNLSTADIAQGWIVVHRDKFGRWVPSTSASSSTPTIPATRIYHGFCTTQLPLIDLDVASASVNFVENDGLPDKIISCLCRLQTHAPGDEVGTAGDDIGTSSGDLGWGVTAELYFPNGTTPPTLTITNNSLSGGTLTLTTIGGVVQRLTSTATSGAFTLTASGVVTASLNYNCTAAEVLAALMPIGFFADPLVSGGPLNTTPINITLYPLVITPKIIGVDQTILYGTITTDGNLNFQPFLDCPYLYRNTIPQVYDPNGNSYPAGTVCFIQYYVPDLILPGHWYILSPGCSS